MCGYQRAGVCCLDYIPLGDDMIRLRLNPFHWELFSDFLSFFFEKMDLLDGSAGWISWMDQLDGSDGWD